MTSVNRWTKLSDNYVGRFIRRYLGLSLAISILLWIFSIAPSFAVKSLARDANQANQPSTELAVETLTTPSLVEQGQQRYQSGQLSQAVTLWQQAMGQATNWQQQVIVLNYLGLVYQDLGQWFQAKDALEQALTLLDTHPRATEQHLYADVLTTQGSWQLHQGQAQLALETWQTAEQLYQLVGAVEQQVRTQINQAQALRSLGFYRQALDLLEQAIAAPLPNDRLKARSLHSLGITLRAIGQLERAQQVLEQALTLVQDQQDRQRIQLSLAHTLRDAGKLEVALASYGQIAQLPLGQRLRVEVTLHQITLHHTLNNHEAAAQLTASALAQLQDISPSRWSIYAQINLAEQMLADDEMSVAEPVSLRLLAQAVQQARELEDSRAEAYALGQLGHRYERAGQQAEALSLTNQALSLANRIKAQEIAVTLYWQQGRLQKQLDNQTLAIGAYSQAVSLLEELGQDLVAINPEIQFSYRNQVEPIYRELVKLLLDGIDQKPQSEQQQRLEQSRNVIEALQLAELQNYFREACQVYEVQSIDQADPLAAVVYPILMAERLEVIVSVPGQPLHHYGSDLSETEGRNVLQDVSAALNPTSRATDILLPAQQLYDQLLRPAEPLLENTQTLVFVLDGFLRNLPMAVLHDGQHFLIEKYRLALTPGLQLLPSRQLQSDRLRVLTGGISESRQGFSALPGVQAEISQVAKSVRSAKVLLNQQFTRRELRSQLQRTPVSVVHLATHGQFSSSADDTFLLTWNDRLQLDDIEQLLTQQTTPIELLVLSACETAAGDNRAALGMAGVAVRSGARSTLATLWPVQDDSTTVLTTTFYQLLLQGSTRADALQQAQQQLLGSATYSHPYYWAPYVLVGHWQ